MSDWKPTVTVELSEDDGGWFAECKSLDYFAGGKDVDEVKAHFADGLMLTALAHRDMIQKRGNTSHRCPICNVTGGGLIQPNFDWRFVESTPA